MALPILELSSLRKPILPDECEKALALFVDLREVAPPPGLSSPCSSLEKSEAGASRASSPTSLSAAEVTTAPTSSGNAAPKTSIPPSQTFVRLDGARWDNWRTQFTLKVGLGTRFASECERVAGPNDSRIILAGISRRAPNVLEIGLQRPTVHDLHRIGDFDQRFGLARARLTQGYVIRRHIVGDTRIGKADRQGIARPPRDHARKGQAGVEVEVHEVPVLRSAGKAEEHADTFRLLAAGHTPQKLIHDHVKRPIVVERLAGVAGNHDQLAADVDAVVLELTEVVPTTDLDGARKLATGDGIAVGTFDHEQRIVVDLEIGAVIVTDLRIVGGTRMRGVTVIEAGHDAGVLGRCHGDTHTRRGQGIGRAAIRIILRRDRGPPPGAVEEVSATVGRKELRVGRELTELHRHSVVEHVLLQPQLEQARGRLRLEARNGHQAADILAGDRVAVDLKTVGVKAQPLP